MQEKIKKQVIDTFLIVMRPIVRIFLRYGIGYREVLEMLKMTYVDIASSDFGIRGRPTNISRIAVMTGLTRKEVRRLRNKSSEGGDKISVKNTPIADVLHHWHSHDEFTDAAGKPKTIPFAGDDGSFSSLVRKFGGDVPAGAMRTELKRVGAVKENEDGSLSLLNRVANVDGSHERLIVALMHSVYPLLSTTAYNSEPGREGDTWAAKTAYTTLVRPGDSVRLRRIAADRITDFAESIDDVFMGYESIQSNDEARSGKPIAVGVFYFEEQDESANYEW